MKLCTRYFVLLTLIAVCIGESRANDCSTDGVLKNLFGHPSNPSAQKPKILLEKNPVGLRIAGKNYINVEYTSLTLDIPDAVNLTHSLSRQLPATVFETSKINEIYVLDDLKDVSKVAASPSGRVNRISGHNIVIDTDATNPQFNRIYISSGDIGDKFSIKNKLDVASFSNPENAVAHTVKKLESKYIGNLVPEQPSVFSGGLISLSAEPPEGFFAASTTAEFKESGLTINKAHDADIWVYRVPDSRQESYFKFQYPSVDRPIDSPIQKKFKIATGIGPSSNPASIGGKDADLLLMGDEQQGVLTSYLKTIGKKDLKLSDLYGHPGIVQKLSDKEVYVGNVDKAYRLTSEGFNALKTDPQIYRKVYAEGYDQYLRSLFEKEAGIAPTKSYLLGTSRGCTQGCTICCSGGLKSFQFFDAPRMMEEINKISVDAKLKPGEVVDVFFVDSNFNNAPKRLIEFADMYEKSPHYGQHRFFVRHNTVNGFLTQQAGVKVPNIELLKAYKKIGIHEIFMGIDTFDDASTITLKSNRLKMIKQGIETRPTYTFDETSNLIAAMEKEGLTSKGFLLTNNPWVGDLDRLDSYYNLIDVWMKNPHFSIDAARDREVLRLKPFDGSPITNVAEQMSKSVVKNNHFVAEGALGEMDELMNFEKMGVPRARSSGNETLKDFQEGIDKIRVKAEHVFADLTQSEENRHQAQLILQKIISRENEMKDFLVIGAAKGLPQADIYLAKIAEFQKHHQNLPAFDPTEQLNAFKKHSKSLFDGLKETENAIPIKKVVPPSPPGIPSGPESGYNTEVKNLSPTAEHTIHDVPKYLGDNLGDDIVANAKNGKQKFVITMGEGSSALDRAQKAGWKIGEPVKKREGFHQIYHATNAEGENALIITRVNGEDRKIHIQSLLKLANVPEEQVLTLGNTMNWKDSYLSQFKSMGYVPDGVVYGFQKTAITGAISANPVMSFPVLAKQAIIDIFNKRSIKNLAQNDLSALPMSVIEFKNGKKIWFFKNIYGDLSDQLFQALDEHGVKNYLYAGTAGSLNPAHEVGAVFTPKTYLDRTGTVQELSWIKSIKGIKNEGQYTRVSTPNVETKQWLRDEQKSGTDLVDVELGYFLDRLRNKKDISAKVTLTVSDVMDGANAKDLTQWNMKDKVTAIDRLKIALDDFLGFKNSNDYRIKKYQSIQINPVVKDVKAQ